MITANLGRVDLELPLAFYQTLLMPLPEIADGYTLEKLQDLNPDEFWREFVKPGLEDSHSDAVSIIRKTLQTLGEGKDELDQVSVVIEKDSSETWYQVLNLAVHHLEEVYGFSENEGDEPKDPKRDRLLIQRSLYRALQEAILMAELPI